MYCIAVEFWWGSRSFLWFGKTPVLTIVTDNNKKKQFRFVMGKRGFKATWFTAFPFPQISPMESLSSQRFQRQWECYSLFYPLAHQVSLVVEQSGFVCYKRQLLNHTQQKDKASATGNSCWSPENTSSATKKQFLLTTNIQGSL